jgi:hypothetical protein
MAGCKRCLGSSCHSSSGLGARELGVPARLETRDLLVEESLPFWDLQGKKRVKKFLGDVWWLGS